MLSRCFALLVTTLVLASAHTAIAAAATLPIPPRPAPNPNPGVYAALGDSVAAGVGLPLIANPTASDHRCVRSASAYPYQIAAATGKTLIHTSCSGAKAGDLYTRQGIRAPMAPQFKKAFASGTPGLITITAGANDVRWQTFLRKCYAARCGTTVDTPATDAYIKFLELKLDWIMYEIDWRSGGAPPTVVLTGYYNPISPACTTLEPRFTAAEVAWATNRLNALNGVIQRVASRYTYTKYAPADFTGHDVCSADPWVFAPNARGALHPTQAGQQAIARSVLGVID